MYSVESVPELGQSSNVQPKMFLVENLTDILSKNTSHFFFYTVLHLFRVQAMLKLFFFQKV